MKKALNTIWTIIKYSLAIVGLWYLYQDFKPRPAIDPPPSIRPLATIDSVSIPDILKPPAKSDIRVQPSQIIKYTSPLNNFEVEPLPYKDAISEAPQPTGGFVGFNVYSDKLRVFIRDSLGIVYQEDYGLDWQKAKYYTYRGDSLSIHPYSRTRLLFNDNLARNTSYLAKTYWELEAGVDWISIKPLVLASYNISLLGGKLSLKNRAGATIGGDFKPQLSTTVGIRF